MTIDGKSKGYHDIDSSLVSKEPTTCIFGHNIDTSRTKIILKSSSKSSSKIFKDQTNDQKKDEKKPLIYYKFDTDSE